MMGGVIKFLGGHLAGAKYIYKKENLLRPYFSGLAKTPDLYLTDFEDIQVISRQPPGLLLLVKCTFANGKESIATVTSSMLEVIQAFLLNKKYLSEGDQYFFPKSYADEQILVTIIFLIFLFYTNIS